ncbi:flagellar hook capping FlgD N-terminal domain-containing protein [Roseobacter weihaiensis]|uniref:flagellar hook capping FlgD N-terminal domain-containing protein n=1 Tax=Roseobacter weihaiensis TaxID=2763262 RepID=UPI001D0ABBDB|nr:flagellar hook capping FlgD N-terminal domain-containing protein [Roseobacter sp. H9]
MDITNTQAAQTTSQIAASQSQASAVLSSDFETFLQMLTAQAKYQDPLEPISSSEYAAQLAQFSMVEQQVLSNDLLTALGAQMTSGNIGQIASWIGLEARTTAPVPFEGEPITILPTSAAGADEVFLIAYGPDGEEVLREQIPTGNEPFEWQGVADDGSTLPSGNYSFAVESRATGQTLSTIPAETYTRITEARRAGSETAFVLSGGSIVFASEIAGLREAPGEIS